VQSVNGKRMTDTAQLLAEIAQQPPGQRATLGILRGGKPQDVSIVVGTRPGQPR